MEQQASLEQPKSLTQVLDQVKIHQVPNNIQEALGSPEWKSAVYEEFMHLKKMEPGKSQNYQPKTPSTAGCKGIHPIIRIDYEETFAPVAKLNTIRFYYLWLQTLTGLHQLDVKNAFLNGDLAEEVYMEIPPGFETQTTRNKVCKLRRSLYGLKQSPRAWYGDCKVKKGNLFVSQRKYVLDLLKETRMLGYKPADTPMDPTTKLGAKENCAPVDKGRYQRLVGKLIYLSHTRPILVFLSAWISTRPRSTSGYCTYVWGNLVTWRSKKQSVVSRSSAEAEFRAMAHDICEGIWLRRVLKELKISDEEPMKMFCDNQSAISIAKNPVHHDRTKHVEIDRHFIKEKIEEGIIKMLYVPTCLQTADILTKALQKGV
ncbi:Retrovirus-related Pol polyprotein from transposon RE1 [Vitis vinifera]|uniref:Retrovirus-related Pol polyprotein from transposon RE1 n=1 Tax=Vitis vinifera TaxID=29760 RepID=A0A438ITU9_VITVI|nr:Retrovirus-related Pol polyprotein from transposon RE1 [Vitis vinifera]